MPMYTLHGMTANIYTIVKVTFFIVQNTYKTHVTIELDEMNMLITFNHLGVAEMNSDFSTKYPRIY